MPSQVKTWAYWTEEPEDVRTLVFTLAAVGGVFVGLYGVYLAGIRTQAADTQARIARESHVTDLFTKAIEQLGSDKLELRLGAIHALKA